MQNMTAGMYPHKYTKHRELCAHFRTIEVYSHMAKTTGVEVYFVLFEIKVKT